MSTGHQKGRPCLVSENVGVILHSLRLAPDPGTGRLPTRLAAGYSLVVPMLPTVVVARAPDGSILTQSFGGTLVLVLDVESLDLSRASSASNWLAVQSDILIAHRETVPLDAAKAFRGHVWRALEGFGWIMHPTMGFCMRCGHAPGPGIGTCHYCHHGSVEAAAACGPCPGCACCAAGST